MIQDSFLKSFRETKSPFITNPYRHVSGAVGGWVELGRTTWASGNSINVSSLPDKRYYMILNYSDSASNYNNIYRFNSDTGSNYAWRRSLNGGTDGTSTSTTVIPSNSVQTDEFQFTTSYIANLAGKEKLVINHGTDASAVGSGTAPDRNEIVGKWTNTTDSIDEITMTTASANYNLGEVVVLGWDPADTHTTNFWEELASVSGDGSSATLDSGTITAKKYLWVQCFTDPSLNSTPQWRVNADSGSNYSERLSTDGGADGTNTSVSIFNIGNTTATPSFSNTFIINNSANEKLFINNWVGVNTAGAGTAPMRRESTTKWANTSSQITSLQNVLPAGVHNSNSLMKVYGSN